MERFLSEEELAKLFKYKKEMSSNLKKSSIQEYEKYIQEIFPDFSYNNRSERNNLIYMAFMCDGDIKNNPEDLFCSKCSSRYIVSFWDGDVYYRLFHGNEETVKKEIERFKKAPLFINRAGVMGMFETTNECLECGYEW